MSSIPITMQNKILITEEMRVTLIKGGDGQTLFRTHRRSNDNRAEEEQEKVRRRLHSFTVVSSPMSKMIDGGDPDPSRPMLAVRRQRLEEEVVRTEMVL